MVFAVINSFLHLLATVVWIGGMIYATFVLMPSLTVLDPPLRGKLMGAVIKKYMPIAWASIAVLIITGIFSAGTSPSVWRELWGTNYGNVLGIKHLIIVFMIFIGVRISFVLGPKAAKLGPSPEGAKIQAQMGKLALINTILGIIVLLLVSILYVV